MKKNAGAAVMLLALASSVLAVDTTIKGGRMELINKGETVVFTGGVRLDRGGDQLKASRMQTNRERDRISAKGEVKLFRQVSSTETWHAFGDDGFYNTQTGSGYLVGTAKDKAHIIHTEILSSTMTRVVNVYADRFDFEKDAQHGIAKGRVEGTTVDPNTNEKYDFWAEQAEFKGNEHTITLSEAPQPIVVQTLVDGRRRLTGDTIVYNTENRSVVTEGNAVAVFEDEKKEKEKKDKPDKKGKHKKK